MKRTRPASLFRSGHRDDNHEQLVEFMALLGGEVIDLSKVRSGCPDVLWGRQGQSILVEIKTRDGSLTPAQKRFHSEWRGGPLIVVTCEADVLAAVETLTKKQGIRTAVRG